MSQTDNLKIVAGFFQERLGLSDEVITENTVLADIGVDSLMLLELLFEFEDDLNINFSGTTQAPKTVGELLILIHQAQLQLEEKTSSQPKNAPAKSIKE